MLERNSAKKSKEWEERNKTVRRRDIEEEGEEEGEEEADRGKRGEPSQGEFTKPVSSRMHKANWTLRLFFFFLYANPSALIQRVCTHVCALLNINDFNNDSLNCCCWSCCCFFAHNYRSTCRTLIAAGCRKPEKNQQIAIKKKKQEKTFQIACYKYLTIWINI